MDGEMAELANIVRLRILDINEDLISPRLTALALDLEHPEQLLQNVREGRPYIHRSMRDRVEEVLQHKPAWLVESD